MSPLSLVAAAAGCILAIGSAAAQRVSTDSLNTLIRRADSLAATGDSTNLRQAIGLFSRALASQESSGEGQPAAALLEKLGEAYTDIGQLDSARVHLRHALDVARRGGDRAFEGNEHHKLGITFFYQGQLDSALAEYREARRIREALGARGPLSATLSNIGLLFRRIGRPDSARAYFIRALNIARELRDRPREMNAVGNLAILAGASGEPDSAIAYFRLALSLSRELKDRRSEGATLNNLGLVFQNLGQLDSARFYHRDALRLARVLGDQGNEGTALHNLGNEFQLAGEADSARVYYTAAVAVARATDDVDGENLALSNLGEVLRALGKRDSAFTVLREVLPRLEKAGDSLGIATTYNAIALVHVDQGNRDSALAGFARALVSFRALKDRQREADALSYIGAVHQDLQPRNPGLATAYFDSASAMHSGLGARAGGDFNRLSLGETQRNTYERWTLAWIARADEVGARQAALASLAATERGRAQALLQLMRTDASVASPPPGADLPKEGERLIGAARPSDGVVLSYLVSRDTLLIWVSTGNHLQVVRVNVDADSLESLVQRWRSSLGVGDASTNTRFARGGPGLEDVRRSGAVATRAKNGARQARIATALASLVLPAQIANSIPRGVEILVVPHGPLNLVPFAALPIGRSVLGSRNSIRYAPSLTAVVEADRRSIPSSRHEALVVGNPTMPTVRLANGKAGRLAPLPGAAAEASAIARALGTKPLLGDEALETTVRERLSSASVVHLATHGYAYASSANARRSFVALAAGRGHDGILSVGEILDDSTLTMSADLVALSACQTGLGDLKQAEGTVGLQRAILAKGGRSVLVSLWNVSDAATTFLMQRFYSHWLAAGARTSKSQALRQAQEDVRRRPGWEAPQYWASFQLVGAR